jgi:hypothetical protein
MYKMFVAIVATISLGACEDLTYTWFDNDAGSTYADAGDADLDAATVVTADANGEQPDAAADQPDTGITEVADANGEQPDAAADQPDSGTVEVPDAASAGLDAASAGPDAAAAGPDAEVAGPDAATVVPDLPAPFRSPTPYVLDISRQYIGNATCALLIGKPAPLTWVVVSEQTVDGYLRTTQPYMFGGATYEFSYSVWDCQNSVAGVGADFGTSQNLARMTADARQYVWCNWYDSANSGCIQVTDFICSLKMSMDSGGNFTPVGNMANFSPDQPGCQ